LFLFLIFFSLLSILIFIYFSLVEEWANG